MAVPIFSGGAATVKGLIWDGDMTAPNPYKIHANTAQNATNAVNADNAANAVNADNAAKLDNHYERELNVSSAVDATNAVNAVNSQLSNWLDVPGTTYYATAGTGSISNTWQGAWNQTLTEGQVLFNQAPTNLYDRDGSIIGHTYGMSGKYTVQSSILSTVIIDRFTQYDPPEYNEGTVYYSDGTHLSRGEVGIETVTITKVLPFGVFVTNWSSTHNGKFGTGSKISCNFKN